ncbi:hypothetical protein JTB14_000997 [Gonioctena quinquepunctata]|nr:hypothetical protein JTB14_000997 [Gonioctena quinquepunctata]
MDVRDQTQVTMDISFFKEIEFEDDPFTEVDEDTLRAEDTAGNIVFYVIISLVKLAVCLTGMAAEVFLLVVLYRFSRLRSIRLNKYILNLTILNIIYYLVAPLYSISEHLVFKHYNATIFLLQTQSTILILYIAFAIGLALDWYLSSCEPKFMSGYEYFHRYVFWGIYVAFVIEWIFAFIYAKNHHMIRMRIFSVFYVSFLILLVIINMLKYTLSMKGSTLKTSHALVTTNIIFFAYFPLFIYHLIISYVTKEEILAIVLFTEFIPNLLVLGHPIMVVYMLGRTDKFFKIAYEKSFKRSPHEVDEGNDLDNATDGDRVSRSNTVQVYANGDERDSNREILTI